MSWAVFNSEVARTLALTLPGDRTWRGLIVDGERLDLNLDGHTLTLGNAGPSLKTYSLRVGEGRFTASALTLRNGTVLASNDVLVGGVFGAREAGATLTLDAGAVLDQTLDLGLGSVLVGDLGPGALVVRGGSHLTTNVLALARKAPVEGDPLRSTLDISGAGSQVHATLVSLADHGDATATVTAGGVVDATGADILVDDGGRLTVTGSGSRLFGFSTLRVNGQLTVNFGSTLEGGTLGLSRDSALQGTGTIQVSKQFTAEGQIKPGNSPGLLRIEGNLVLTDSAELVLEVAGTTAVTDYDVLKVTGNLTLGGGHVNLAFIDGFAPRQGQQFVLLDVGGAFQNSATIDVTGLEAGWLFDTAYDLATGKLTLHSLSDRVSAVPEPAGWALWGAGGLVGWLMRRRVRAFACAEGARRT